MSSLTVTLARKESAVLQSERSADQVRAVGQRAGWRVVDLELTEPTAKADFLEKCARAFELPKHFGRNWDALADCIDEIQDQPGVLVAFSGAGYLSDHDREIVRDIFAERVELGPCPFVVVAAGAAWGPAQTP